MEPVLNKTLLKLTERAKELECLYKVEEAISMSGNSEKFLFEHLLKIIPSGMQYSTICEAQIIYGDSVLKTEEYRETDWQISANLVVDNEIMGHIQVVYTQLIEDNTNKNQFLPEEQRMLNNIASRVSCWLLILVIRAANMPPGKAG